MTTPSTLDVFAALTAMIVVAQSLTLGAIQALRIHDGAAHAAAARADAHRRGLPAPPGLTTPGSWLLLTLALAALLAFGDLVEHLGLSLAAYWLSPAHDAALLLVGPAMWFYAMAITCQPDEAPPTWRRLARHAAPAGVLAAVLAAGVVLDPLNVPPASGQRSAVEVIVLLPIAAQILVYLAAVVRRVRQQKSQLEERFSSVQHRQLRWLEVGAWTFALLVLAWTGSWGLPVAASNIITNGLLAVDVAVLGIFGARQRNVFAASPWLGDVSVLRLADRQHPVEAPQPRSAEVAGADTSDAPDALPAEDDGQPVAGKYAKSAMAPALAQEIAERLGRHVEVDKPYLECDLTLGDLAASVQATPHQLSQVLSTCLGLSFFDYINGLRVEAVKATLARPQSIGRPLLDIALECGFGSKSAFNEAFKRGTGMSPSAYRKSLPAAAVLAAAPKHPHDETDGIPLRR